VRAVPRRREPRSDVRPVDAVSRRGARAGGGNLEDTQAKVAQFVTGHDLDVALVPRVLDLLSELGELAKQLLEETNYGKRRAARRASPALRSELGDVAFALLALANHLEVDLSVCVDEVLLKYEVRIGQEAAIRKTERNRPKSLGGTIPGSLP
jgi:NTP pyrophosphatase (non-canonical NTP hydrolase)